MPQLNPTPWLFYFITTWLIFLCLITFKTYYHLNMNKPKTKKTEASPLKWYWPWQ